MSKNIPNKVQQIADQECCNSVRKVGQYMGRDVYGLGSVDDEGLPIPTGLPLLVLWNGEKTEVVTGEKSLELLSRLE